MSRTNQQNNNRRSVRRDNPPQRVTEAADQMYNTSPHGTYRGYVPQNTGAQRPAPYAVPPANNAAPVYNSSNGGGQRGFVSPPPPQKPKKRGKALTAVIITILAAAVIVGVVYAGMRISKDTAEKQRISDKVSPYDGLYCPGVYVDGIHLGGMTPEQAMNSVQSQISQRNSNWKVQLTFEGAVAAEINAEMLNMSVDQNHLIEVMNDAWTRGHTGTQADRYEQMEALEQTPYSVYTSRPTGNTGAIDSLLASLKSAIDIQAQDAYLIAFDPSYAYPFLFSREVVGRTLDIEPVIRQLYQMVSTMTSGTLELVPQTVQPQVTQAELEKHYALRASATTPIDKHSTEDRNNNIRRCFELISGTVLENGKTFSFNGVVGERSLNNGFYPAIEYINDEHVVGVGGGACQASTTLYQAAVCAGMQITSRRPHSDSVSYAEYGTDATVYWMRGGKQIDMCFKNTSGANIYIVAQVMTDPANKAREMCKVSIYGEELGNTVYRLEVDTVEILPSLLEPVYVKDKANASKAKDGCIVNSYRATYIDGTLTDRTLLFTDTYNPKPEKIYDPLLAGE